MTPAITPSFMLCLKDDFDQFHRDKLEQYNLSIKGYQEDGVWESEQTRANGLTVDDVLEELLSPNFMLVDEKLTFGI